MLRFAPGILILLLTASPLFGKKQPPPPEPQPNRGSVGLVLHAWSPLPVAKSAATKIYFVRIENEKDWFEARTLIASNYQARGGLVFLLNAEPGRYAAVAAQVKIAPIPGGDPICRVFFDQDMIPQTEVVVSAGTIVFGGDFTLQTSAPVNPSKRDRAQLHYHSIMPPRNPKSKTEMAVRWVDWDELGQLEKKQTSTEAEANFWRVAKEKAFSGNPAWIDLIARSQNHELAKPEGPKTPYERSAGPGRR